MRDEKNIEFTKYVDTKLDEADQMAIETDIRYTADEVFNRVKKRIMKQEKI